jgi:hypothetical protein
MAVVRGRDVFILSALKAMPLLHLVIVFLSHNHGQNVLDVLVREII